MRSSLMRLIRMNPLRSKDSRREFLGGNSGGAKSMKSEQYQKMYIERETNTPCEKIYGYRLNQRCNIMEIKKSPMKEPSGFDYTEDFDAVQTVGEKYIFINLKNVCGSGGAQTRTMREVYHFIETQCKCLDVFTEGGVILYDDTRGMSILKEVYFANILDGDEIESKKDHFDFVFGFYPEWIKNRIYIGTSENYKAWFDKNINVI